MIELLMHYAEADASVLQQCHAMGDNFSTPRDVDFYFVADTPKKADIVSGFLNDFNYAAASIEERDDGQFGVKAILYMPINQPIIQSVSGFMCAVAQMFQAEYAGWGSCPQIEE